MSQQLFYGKIQDFSNPIGNGSNSYIRVRFDAATNSTTLENVTDVTGYLGLSSIRVGQQLVESSAFPSGVEITGVDVGNQTITVASLPATAESQGLGRISPAEGDYYIASASLSRPNSTDPTFNNITGSDDSNYTDSPIYAILGQAANSSQQIINGRFHKYIISEVTGRNAGGTEASLYVKWGESGSQADSGDELFESVVATPLVELSKNDNLAPIFSRTVNNLANLNSGQEVAAYQIETINFFDDLVQTDILQTGSLVSKNNAIINFSGSGVQVDASGSDGVVVRIDGGGGGGSGTSGSSGSSGTSGSSGSSGTSGSSGSSGTSGSSGNGTSGSSGSSGTSGSSGNAGTSGSSGSSGTSGSSGSSGTSGSSGQGVPTGGTAAQVLAKVDGTDYNTEWVDQSGGGGGGASYNPVVRYQVSGGDNVVTVMSSGNVEGGLSWSRSSTTLTVTKASHGLSVGDYVIIRNMSEDYSYLAIQTVPTVNTFTVTVADSGGSSGTEGAYIPAFDISSFTDTALTIEAPSAGNCQLMSLTHFIDTMENTSVLVTVPSNALTNGAGGNNSLNTRVPPQATAHDLSGGTASQIGNTTIQFSTTANHNVYTVTGGLDTFDNIIYNLQF